MVPEPVGPFVYLDVLGPFEFPAGRRIHVPDHSHTGIATISHLLEGEGWHGDDLGHELALTERSVNWMAAGNGIVHHEGLSDRFSATGGNLVGIQAWVMLTPEERRAPAAFVHTPAAALPRRLTHDLALTLISGDFDGLSVMTTTARKHAAIVVEAFSRPGSVELSLTAGWEYVVHILDGRGLAGGHFVGVHDGVRATSAGGVEVGLEAGSRAIVLAGEPLDEPVISAGSHIAASIEELQAAQRHLANSAVR